VDHLAGIRVATVSAVIREFADRDAEGVGELLRDIPWRSTPAAILHWILSMPPRAHVRTWVAEEAGEIVGWAETNFKWAIERDDVAGIWVFVRPDRRCKRIGTRLYEAGARHDVEHGARELTSIAYEDEGGHFLLHRGFERKARQDRLSAVDPRTANVSVLELPEGFRFCTLAELQGRDRELYELYAEAFADMPERATNLEFDVWVAKMRNDPQLSEDGSFVVLAGERPVALAWISVAGRQAEHAFTGTARAYRRRGLARAAKVATIRWCAEHGIERVTTGNSTRNAGMLAINDELGFRPWITWQHYVLRL
jgi:GNAT superfamily N-acetyltransferase